MILNCIPGGVGRCWLERGGPWRGRRLGCGCPWPTWWGAGCGRSSSLGPEESSVISMDHTVPISKISSKSYFIISSKTYFIISSKTCTTYFQSSQIYSFVILQGAASPLRLGLSWLDETSHDMWMYTITWELHAMGGFSDLVQWIGSISLVSADHLAHKIWRRFYFTSFSLSHMRSELSSSSKPSWLSKSILDLIHCSIWMFLIFSKWYSCPWTTSLSRRAKRCATPGVKCLELSHLREN